MTHSVDAVSVVQTVGSLLYIALGVWVLTLTPRRRQTLLLGAFAVLFGLTYGPTNVLQIFHLVAGLDSTAVAVQLPFAFLSFAAALGLAWSVPEPLEDRRLLVWSLGIGGLFAIPHLVAMLVTGDWGRSPVSGPILAIALFVSIAWPIPALLLTLRGRSSTDADPGEVTQLAILAVAFATLFAFTDGMRIPIAARRVVAGAAPVQYLRLSLLTAWGLVAGLWGWNMVRAHEDTVRTHRAAMLAILGLIVGGALYQAAFPDVLLGRNVMRGVMRTLGVGLLAYGVLRHDLAGLDAKVEWSISKTTVAGVFVAVFFVVSEGAQVLFAGVVNNQILGIIAAGALLFALSPIQRAADKIAEEVVPGGDAEAASDARARYRKAVELALADGEISPEERRHLAERAEELDLSPTEVVEIQEQVEDEAEGGEAA